MWTSLPFRLLYSQLIKEVTFGLFPHLSLFIVVAHFTYCRIPCQLVTLTMRLYYVITKINLKKWINNEKVNYNKFYKEIASLHPNRASHLTILAGSCILCYWFSVRLHISTQNCSHKANIKLFRNQQELTDVRSFSRVCSDYGSHLDPEKSISRSSVSCQILNCNCYFIH